MGFCYLSNHIQTGDKEEKRSLGLVLLRGENLVSMTVEGPPPQNNRQRGPGHGEHANLGAAKAAGRGMPPQPMAHAPPGQNTFCPTIIHLFTFYLWSPFLFKQLKQCNLNLISPGLQGPVHGVGGPGPGMMAPRPGFGPPGYNGPPRVPMGMGPPGMRPRY